MSKTNSNPEDSNANPEDSKHQSSNNDDPFAPENLQSLRMSQDFPAWWK